MAERVTNGKPVDLGEYQDDLEPAPGFLTNARDADYPPGVRKPTPRLSVAGERALSTIERDAFNQRIADLEDEIHGLQSDIKRLMDKQQPSIEDEIAGLLAVKEAEHAPLDAFAVAITELRFGAMMEHAAAVTKGEGYKPPDTPEAYASALHKWGMARRSEAIKRRGAA